MRASTAPGTGICEKLRVRAARTLEGLEAELGPALATLDNEIAAGMAGQYDFVFIDADKAGYLDYVNYLLDSPLLSPDAVIVVDNTLMQGQPYTGQQRSANGDAIAAFNTATASQMRATR